MCMTCGCRDYDNDHGDPKNITYRRLVDAAEAGGVTVEEAVEHLRAAVAELRKSGTRRDGATPRT